MKSYDIIVIGAGHNGLIVASKLAASGRKVLLLEAGETYGGMARSEVLFEGFQAPELASNAVGISKDVVQDLGLNKYELLFNEDGLKTVSLSLENDNILFGSDFGKSIHGIREDELKRWKELRNKFFNQSHLFQRLASQIPVGRNQKTFGSKANLIVTAAKMRMQGKEQFQELLRMITMCIADLVEEELETSSLKGLISFDSTLGIKLGPRSPTSYLGLLYKLSQMKDSYQEKSLSIHGGVTSFIDALFKSAEENGVAFVFKSKVGSISISGSVATGVKLENGVEYSAKTIVSAISPVNTFIDLVGPQNLETDLTRRIKALRCSGNTSKFNIILEDFPKLHTPQNSDANCRYVYAPSIDSVESNFNSLKYNELPSDPNFEMYFSKITSESSLKGAVLASICIQNTPYSLKDEWKKSKQVLINKVISTIQKWAPEFKKGILFQSLLLPHETEKKYFVSGGHWHHNELQIDSLYSLRPTFDVSDYSTPIDGLFICGAGTHPGGNLFGLSGLNAAKKILRESSK